MSSCKVYSFGVCQISNIYLRSTETAIYSFRRKTWQTLKIDRRYLTPIYLKYYYMLISICLTCYLILKLQKESLTKIMFYNLVWPGDHRNDEPIIWRTFFDTVPHKKVLDIHTGQKVLWHRHFHTPLPLRHCRGFPLFPCCSCPPSYRALSLQAQGSWRASWSGRSRWEEEFGNSFSTELSCSHPQLEYWSSISFFRFLCIFLLRTSLHTI